ncbi:MAG: 1-deoxy-D-xylulose-5-phosphate synthase [Ruminococcaceae bacterium]|nr:1-deoxy-D-xylulose-5-phosphate synthase [Oscillospiraceae bacterium]
MKKFLDDIHSSADIKKLNIPELEVLAGEIRQFLINNISKSGGHLSSNLGTVELTLALHKVFDFSADKIVWDVGHQSYTHKIITGRKDSFDSLRQQDGISGFPKTEENAADAFNTGHSSTSISAALGFAKAFELQGIDASSVAVIGDGALTGGMAFEAMNHAGSSSAPLIVVLNDNGMSISQNVGGLSDYLEKLSSRSEYISLKVKINNFLKNLPFWGEPFRKFIHKSKHILKKILLQKKLFENFGLEYLGPIDGHDLGELVAILSYAKTLKYPVIVHAVTQKGKGYTPSEADPSYFHGVNSFDPDTGMLQDSKSPTYSDIFGRELLKLAKDNPKIVAVTAAMPDGTGLSEFAKRFPDRFFDTGIAEQHAVTFSAALAKGGLTPVFAVYSTFLQRGYDQILHDVALQNLHAIFAIDRAGATGSDGETHQGIYDLSYLSHIPNMTIMAPANEAELRQMLRLAVNDCTGPVAIRYPKGTADRSVYGDTPVEYGKGALLGEDGDILIVAIGTAVKDAVCAAKLLSEKNISAKVMNARFLKPFDSVLFKKAAKYCRLVAVIEDNVEIGGLAAAIRKEYGGEVLGFAFPDVPLMQGTVPQQKLRAGLTPEQIANKISEVLGE